MAARNERVFNLAQDWLKWLRCRRFLSSAPQKNVLAMLIEKNRPQGEQPDGEMSAEIAAFNLVVSGLDDMDMLPFAAVYCNFRPLPVKSLAAELGIQSAAFYERAHDIATRVYADTLRLKHLHEQMQREVLGFTNFPVSARV